jgi:salicylate hydroxylase
VVYWLRRGELLNFVGCPEDPSWDEESWNQRRPWQELKNAYVGWNPKIQMLIDAADPDQCFRWSLFDRKPIRNWSTERVTLLGDAAHPMLPHLGQGANQGIEDALALAAVLKNASPADVPAALRRYAQVRRRRTDVVQANSRRNGERYDQVNRTVDGRDRELIDTRKLRAWIYDYDVEAEPELTSWTGPPPLNGVL